MSPSASKAVSDQSNTNEIWGATAFSIRPVNEKPSIRAAVHGGRSRRLLRCHRAASLCSGGFGAEIAGALSG
jgi:hypothetical protein